MIFFKWCKPLQPHYVSPHRRSKLKIASVLQLLIFLLVFTISSNAYAQEVNLKVKDASLESVFNEIKKQTGYGFWYEQDVIKNADKITVKIKNLPLKQALDLCLKNQPLDFKIVDRTIVITSKAKTKSEPLKNGIVTGTVTDQDNRALAGATIIENLTGKSAQTDENGNFSLLTTAKSGSITVSYIGYQDKTVSFSDKLPISIKLIEDLTALRTVEINTGYYSVKQKQLTGSISSVKADQIEKQPISNPVLALQGRVTGAYVQQTTAMPGAPVNVIIRGQNSLDAGTSPLYLVDGVPFGQQSLSTTLTASNFGTTGSSPFATLAPDDIESIDILKDADATAIYGSRGANGVVLITTKKGKTGKLTVDLHTYFGSSQLTRSVKMLNSADYLALRKTAFALDNTTVKATDHDLNGNWDQNRYTDWQQTLLGRTADFSNLRLSASGGSATNNFLLSATRQYQGTITPGKHSYYKNGLHFSAGQRSVDKKFQLNASINYSADRTNWINSDLANAAVTLSPTAPELYTADGRLNWANSSWVNPLRNLARPYNAKNTNLITSGSASYLIIEGLSAMINAGYTASSLEDSNYLPSSYSDPAQGAVPANSAHYANNTSLNSYVFEPQLSYSHSSRLGQLSLLGGFSAQQQELRQLATLGTGFPTDAMIENLMAASTLSVRGYTVSTYRHSGIYGRIGYVAKERYILNLTARRDGSSRFGVGRRQATFGAIGLAYLLSETRFIREQVPTISLFKMRITYGTSGNDQIGDYEYLNTYRAATGYNGTSGLSPVRHYNPDFAWEINRKAEAGIEVGLFKDRLRFSAGYYRNRSTSQLIAYPLPSMTGFSSIRANLNAKVQNTGLELELNYNHKKNGLHWETSINYTIPKSKLLEFPNLASSSYATRYSVGEPLTIGKVYKLLGVDPLTGVYSFADLNSDGVISAIDRQHVVRRGQRGYGGWFNSFSYKGFDLSLLIQFVSQRSSTFRAQLSSAPGRLANMPSADKGKYWAKPGDIAQFQRPTSGANSAAVTAFNNYTLSDAAIGEASFVRLKNLSITYKIMKLIPGKTLRLTFQGQNLYTVSRYFGIDPENTGLSTPPLQTLTMGIQLTL